MISDHCPIDNRLQSQHRWEAHQVSTGFHQLPLRIITVGMSRWGPREIVERQQSGIFGIEMVTAGMMEFSQNRCDYEIAPGQVFFLKKNARHYYRTGRRGFVHKRFLTLEGAALDPILQANGIADTDCLTLDKPAVIIDLLRRSYQLLLHKPSDYQQQSSILAYQLLLELGKNYHPTYPHPLQLALDFMERNLAHNPTRADIAQAAGLSETHFNRLFRQHLHASPVAWLIKRKMELACHYLTATSMSIKEIASTLGFADQLYFSAQFKKQLGLSPSHFAQQKRPPRFDQQYPS